MSEKKRVIVLGDLTDEGLERLRAEGFEVDAGDWPQEELLRRLPGCHALVVGPTFAVSAEMLRAGPDLEMVGCVGAGVSGIDVDEATRRGIVVADTPQSNVISEAEQALALVLACARDLTGAHADLRAGRWEQARWAGSSVEVRGRTLGIVGFGAPAALVAEGARAMGMRVLAFDEATPAERFAEVFVEAAAGLDALCAEADFVLVDSRQAAPAQGLIGDAQFALMKRGVRVVCLAPPGTVDPAAWARAVDAGVVTASAVAVYAGQRAEGDPLAGRDGVLLAPHLEESTVDARRRAGLMIADQVAAVLRGEFAANAVNVPVSLVDDAAELMPFLGLCTQLGRLLGSLTGAPVSDVDVTYGGSFAYFDTRILTLGVLGGLLAGRTHGPVNYVNAQSIADAHGLAAHEANQAGLPDFPRLITVSAEGPEGRVSVSGTSLGPEHKPRLVRVFGEDIDIALSPHMAFLRYGDAPGVGGALGTLLGEWGVNIGHMSVGRGTLEDQAVMALTLDEPLTAAQVDELVARCRLAFGRAVEL